MTTLPIDNKDGLVVTVSILRNGTGKDISHYLEDEHLQSEGQLKNILDKASDMLCEDGEYKKI